MFRKHIPYDYVIINSSSIITKQVKNKNIYKTVHTKVVSRQTLKA